jgi:hypothetical protein
MGFYGRMKKNRFKKADLIEELIQYCSCCGEEEPICSICNEIMEDEYYCNNQEHICMGCYISGRHRRRK